MERPDDHHAAATMPFHAISAAMGVIVGAMVLTTLPVANATETTTVTKHYELPAGARVGSVDDELGISEDGTVDVGGVTFDPIGGHGKQWIHLTAEDDHSPSGTVRVSVCQDVDGDGACTPGLDRDLGAYCLTADPKFDLHTKWATVRRVRRDLPITVNVEAVYPCMVLPVPLREFGYGTSGSVTIRY